MMEESEEISSLNIMEIMLESDEEDASLIEEMERIEIERAKRQMENVGCEKMEREEMECEKIPPTQLKLAIKESIVATENGEITEECSTGIEKYGNVDVREENRTEEEEDLGNLYEFLLSGISEVNNTNGQNKDVLLNGYTGKQYEMDRVQVLKLDCSASELLFAKSAVAIRTRALEASKCDNFPDNAILENLHPDSKDQILDLPDSFMTWENTSLGREEESNYPYTENDLAQKKQASLPPKKKQKVSSNGHIYSDEWFQEDKQFKAAFFQCNVCDFRTAFTKSNIPEIMAHISPQGRYFQVPDTSPSELLKDYKENVKMNLWVAKNKDKTQVRFTSYVACKQCKADFPLDVEHSGKIITHSNKCNEMYPVGSFYLCIFCNATFHRCSLRRHLSISGKCYCQSFKPVTLQLMTCVCKAYAEEHKPTCVVCNKKCWPFVGQHSHQKPVCQWCRDTICSGKTTQLYRRELSRCALCSKKCSSNVVAYWASELESLFIGEKCIQDLLHPQKKKVSDLVRRRNTKIRKILVTGLNSLYGNQQQLDKSLSDQHLRFTLQPKNKIKVIGENKLDKRNLDNCCENNKMILNFEKTPKKKVTKTWGALRPVIPTASLNGKVYPASGCFQFLNKRLSPLSATLHPSPPFSISPNASSILPFLNISSITNPISNKGKYILMVPSIDGVQHMRILPNSYPSNIRVQPQTKAGSLCNQTLPFPSHFDANSEELNNNLISESKPVLPCNSFPRKFKSIASPALNSCGIHQSKVNNSQLSEDNHIFNEDIVESKEQGKIGPQILSTFFPNPKYLGKFFPDPNYVKNLAEGNSAFKYVVKSVKSATSTKDTIDAARGTDHVVIKTSSTNNNIRVKYVAPPLVTRVISTDNYLDLELPTDSDSELE